MAPGSPRSRPVNAAGTRLCGAPLASQTPERRQIPDDITPVRRSSLLLSPRRKTAHFPGLGIVGMAPLSAVARTVQRAEVKVSKELRCAKSWA